MRCLIIGQGIAGATLAWTLRKAGASVTVADAGFPHQSSSIAAGIINPITGKRYVKSWRFEELYPVARQVYRAMEADWGVSIWHDQTILRFLTTPEEANNWAARMADPDYTLLMGERKEAGDWSGFLGPAVAFGEIRQAVRVDFKAVMAGIRTDLQASGLYGNESVPMDAIARLTTSYDAVICCEGYRGSQNRFFPGLAWQLAKGEAFLIRIPVARAEGVLPMVKKTALLAPLGDGLFWAGATYNWTFEDTGPTLAEGALLESHLKDVLVCPYQIVQRMGGVRPTVKDRRPFLGASPVHPKVFMFNGLGTKGALLAPYWAQHFTEHLLQGSPLDPAVDIRRFYA